MLLSGKEIHDLITSGKMEVEPLVEAYQIDLCSIELRIGTSIITSPNVAEVQSIEIGHSLRVNPSHHLLFVTLESLKMPIDVAGLVMLRNTFSRIGLLMIPLRIDPGWRGKLVLDVFNLSTNPVELYVGQRIVSIMLFKLSLTPDIFSEQQKIIDIIRDKAIDSGILVPKIQYNQDTDTFSREYVVGEFADLTEVVNKMVEKTTSTECINTKALVSLLNGALSEEDHLKKGKFLEDFAEHLIVQVQGLIIIKRNARLKAEEIDFIVRNNVDSTFGRSLGNPIIVECKNWNKKIGVSEIDHLAAKMTSLSPDVKLGILIAVNGVSGNCRHDADLRRREYRQRGKYIVVLERDDLKQIASGDRTTWEVIEKRYSDLFLI